jgi:KaiC/GvpD/RAD55 family RecA-like ATPase
MLAMTSDFARLWALGYTSLVPIIPPDAEISEHSSLYKRVGTRQDSRGKSPGVMGRDSKWRGFDWLPHIADEQDLQRWEDMGAGVGIKTGKGLIAIDADTLREDLAEIIRDTVTEVFGNLPIRIGRYPKAIYLIRSSEAVQYQRIEFGQPDERGNKERVELLSDGRQFVAYGIHPSTKKPYHWPKGLPPEDTLPTATPEALERFWGLLRARLPNVGAVIKEGATTEVNQASLTGDHDTVAAAVRATPNTSTAFPTREAYRDMGYAIKAALPDDPRAFDIWWEWCARWDQGDNDYGVAEADWRRMKPPYRRGAGWLYEQAENLSNGHWSKAQAYFEPVAEVASPFDAQAEAQQAENKADDTYPVLDIDSIVARPPPTFLVDQHIPDTSMGFLYSEPGVGKSFCAIDLGLTIAHGLPDWHGYTVTAPDNAAVIYLASEGSFDLRNRILAWHKARALEKIAKSFLVIEATINFMHADDVNKLMRTIHATAKARGVKPALVVIDTVSRAMPGADENTQRDMTLFVKATDAVRDQFKCAVMGVHHANKGNGDMRGSTVLRGAGDYVMRLEKAKGASVATLTMEKQKAAQDGWARQVVFERVVLDDGQTSLVPSALMAGPGGVRAGSPEQGGAAGEVYQNRFRGVGLDVVGPLVLQAMAAAWDEGAPWGVAPQTKERYAVRRMAADFEVKADEAEQLLRAWVAGGLLTVETDTHSKRRGYRVLSGSAVLSQGQIAGGGGQCQGVEGGVFG